MSSALQTNETFIRRWLSRRRDQRLAAISIRAARSWSDPGAARVVQPGDPARRTSRRAE